MFLIPKNIYELLHYAVLVAAVVTAVPYSISFLILSYVVIKTSIVHIVYIFVGSFSLYFCLGLSLLVACRFKPLTFEAQQTSSTRENKGKTSLSATTAIEESNSITGKTTRWTGQSTNWQAQKQRFVFYRLKYVILLQQVIWKSYQTERKNDGVQWEYRLLCHEICSLCSCSSCVVRRVSYL